MVSSYSPLKVELMVTGEDNTTWGDITNINLGTALEEAITQTADVTFASADVALTLVNLNTSQSARRARLNLIGTTGGAVRSLIVPTLQKAYIVNNACADTITVKNATGTGVAVPAGKTMWVYNNSTNVVDVVTYLSSLTLGTPLPPASGGTGIAALGTGVATALGINVSAAGSFVINGGALGTPSGGTVTNLTGTASININGTVGATTPTTGAFTSIAYTTTLTGGTGIVNFGSGQFYKDASGNVGVGIIPIVRLDVAGAGSRIRTDVSGADVSVIASNPSAASYANYAFDAAVHIWKVSSAEAMRLNASLNLGLGVSNPLVRLDIAGAGSRIRTDVSGASVLVSVSTPGAGSYAQYTMDALSYAFNISGSSRFVIDASGNSLNIGSGSLGYGTGSGGAVTQLTSRTTGVTLNKTNGAITMFSAAGSTTPATFTVTNSTITKNDVIVLSIQASTNIYNAVITQVRNGSFDVTFYSLSGTAVDAPILNFAKLSAVAA